MNKQLLTTSLLILVSAQALAQECSVNVDSTDQMTFNTKNIQINKSCDRFTVNLQHSGSMPKAVMGHNWVLSTSDDAQSIAADGAGAGIEKSYVKDNDQRVIAHTKVIGAGEKDSVTFDVSSLQADTQYTFFCSVPGHIAMMKGTLTVK